MKELNSELKKLIDSFCSTYSNTLTPILKLLEEVDLEEAVRAEITMFLMYLSASDGTIK